MSVLRVMEVVVWGVFVVVVDGVGGVVGGVEIPHLTFGTQWG